MSESEPIRAHDRVINQQPQHFSMIYHAFTFYAARTLSGEEVRLYLVLHGFTNTNRPNVHPSLGMLAKCCNTSVRSVQRYLQTLVEHKLITIETVHNPTNHAQTNNTYYLLPLVEGQNYITTEAPDHGVGSTPPDSAVTPPHDRAVTPTSIPIYKNTAPVSVDTVFEEEPESARAPSPPFENSPYVATTYERILPPSFVLNDEMRSTWQKMREAALRSSVPIDVSEIDVEQQTRNFCDFSRARKRLSYDWMADWRIWMEGKINQLRRDRARAGRGFAATVPLPPARPPQYHNGNGAHEGEGRAEKKERAAREAREAAVNEAESGIRMIKQALTNVARERHWDLSTNQLLRAVEQYSASGETWVRYTAQIRNMAMAAGSVEDILRLITVDQQRPK